MLMIFKLQNIFKENSPLGMFEGKIKLNFFGSNSKINFAFCGFFFPVGIHHYDGNVNVNLLLIIFY